LCDDSRIEAKAAADTKGARDLTASDAGVNAATARGEQYGEVLHPEQRRRQFGLAARPHASIVDVQGDRSAFARRDG